MRVFLVFLSVLYFVLGGVILSLAADAESPLKILVAMIAAAVFWTVGSAFAVLASQTSKHQRRSSFVKYLPKG